MPQLIRTIEEILAEKKADLYILQFFNYPNDNNGLFFYQRDRAINKTIRETHLKWFEERSIWFEMVSPESVICGWNGQYYVDICDNDLKDYCRQFEDLEGKSLEFEKFQMYIIPYKKHERR